MKYTKIVCTIGPASEKQDILDEIVAAGMDIARLNFSHGTYTNHRMLIKRIRSAAKEAGRHVGIMQDLQGPKIRVGELRKPLEVVSGQKILLGRGGIPIQFDLSKAVKKGQTILIDDGTIELTVIEVKPGSISCVVVVGGQIISHKGINIPESKTDFSVFTEKDRRDLEFGLKNGVDMVAMSFVRSAKDIEEVRTFVNKKLRSKEKPWIIAKIEKAQAIKNLDAIINVSDAIMVARGDLGLEDKPEQVPIYQKIIIKKCLQQNKPVIVATQMLDSMQRNPRPTRAEVSDVANAVLDHTDAVMLSGETAFGKYPLKAVTTMSRVVSVTDNSFFNLVPMRKNFAKDSVLRRAVILAKKHKEPLVVYSPYGKIAQMISNLRQELPTYAFSDSLEICRKLSLVWGVTPIYLESKLAKTKYLEQYMFQRLLENGLIKGGQKLILLTAITRKGNEKLFSAQLKKA